MILLELQVTLRQQQKNPAVAASPFLGGVLHGVLEHLVRQYAPAICQDLGITAGNRPKYYAVIPPPYGWCPASGATCILPCGFVLYGPARQHAARIAALFAHWQVIRLNGCVDKVQHYRLRTRIPGYPASPWQQSTDVITLPPPNFHAVSAPPPVAESLTLNFLTPLKLGRQSAHPTAPQLLRIVRSLTRRIRTLEPALAAASGMDSASWTAAEEQIRKHPLVSSRLSVARWYYGSRSRAAPFPCNGLLGAIHYAAPLPANIATVLHWGAWFGVGEGTAFGQGRYILSGRSPSITFA